MSAISLGEAVTALDAAYDPGQAESWDAVGLVCGDPAAPVTRVHVAVDPTEAVVAEAIDAGADLLVVHHPLLLRGVTALPATTPAGRIVAALNRSDCALHVAHTNADVARPGVSDALLSRLGIDPTDADPLRPGDAALDALAVYVPRADRAVVFAALTGAGAGAVGDYTDCGWWSEGTGTFLPGDTARPALGSPGVREEVREDRLEVVLPRGRRGAVVAALRAAHPYEEPAFWTWPLRAAGRHGLGRIAELPETLTLRQFADLAAASLPSTVWGVRASGDPAVAVRRVAVCGGAGGDLAGAAAALGADVLLTSDLKHHVTLDAPLPLVDVAHWATERPWCDAAAGVLSSAFGAQVTVAVSDLRTDPWSVHAPSPHDHGPDTTTVRSSTPQG